MADLAITVTLSIQTCRHGHVYAIPNWVTSVDYQCPMCAANKYSGLQEDLEKQFTECTRLGRVIAGLRGALKVEKGQKRR